MITLIKFWLCLDLIAFILISFRDDAKELRQTISYDYQQGFYVQAILFTTCLLMYAPFTIPYTILKLIRDNKK